MAMKSLVVTTGAEKFIMKTWLPSLRNKGKYNGDVLIVDYFENTRVSKQNSSDNLPHLQSFSEETVDYLQSQPNILYRKVHNVYDCMASDRIKGFYQCLELLWAKYDVILITDGNDIEFLEPIQPLLDMATNELCAAREAIPNQAYSEVPAITKFPQEYLEITKKEQIINAGIIAGPPNQVKPLLEFMLKNMKLYTSEFFSEQISLNAWVYYLKNPIRFINSKWNTLVSMGEKITFSTKVKGTLETLIPQIKFKVKFTDLEKPVLTNNDGTEEIVAILHMHEASRNDLIYVKYINYFPLIDGLEHPCTVAMYYDLRIRRVNLIIHLDSEKD
jgi:hypothetical protein